MRLIAVGTLAACWEKHPETREPLRHWLVIVKSANWTSMNEIQREFPKAKVLNGDRVRFPIRGGDYRLVVAFDFRRQIAFVKFVGTHAEYDKIDALTVSYR